MLSKLLLWQDTLFDIGCEHNVLDESAILHDTFFNKTIAIKPSNYFYDSYAHCFPFPVWELKWFILQWFGWNRLLHIFIVDQTSVFLKCEYIQFSPWLIHTLSSLIDCKVSNLILKFNSNFLLVVTNQSTGSRVPGKYCFAGDLNLLDAVTTDVLHPADQ